MGGIDKNLHQTRIKWQEQHTFYDVGRRTDVFQNSQLPYLRIRQQNMQVTLQSGEVNNVYCRNLYAEENRVNEKYANSQKMVKIRTHRNLFEILNLVSFSRSCFSFILKKVTSLSYIIFLFK